MTKLSMLALCNLSIISRNCKMNSNVRKTIAVIHVTFAVTIRKPDKIQAWLRFKPLTSAIPVQRYNQLSWELVIKSVHYKPEKDE